MDKVTDNKESSDKESSNKTFDQNTNTVVKNEEKRVGLGDVYFDHLTLCSTEFVLVDHRRTSSFILHLPLTPLLMTYGLKIPTLLTVNRSYHRTPN